MYLLNQKSTNAIITKLKFTFHYVSIKSMERLINVTALPDLHSTMYLLNRGKSAVLGQVGTFTFHYVSIKSGGDDTLQRAPPEFTFHYVSIKSDRRG